MIQSVDWVRVFDDKPSVKRCRIAARRTTGTSSPVCASPSRIAGSTSRRRRRRPEARIPAPHDHAG